jgi:DNA-binding transcriptional LysR family regulator
MMNIANVDLNLIRVFQALLLECNVTRAAGRLHLSQSATSNALARLRIVFSDPLFVRTPHGMEPTEKARKIGDCFERALTEIVVALDTTNAFDPATSTRSFRIATTDHALFSFLPDLAKGMETIAPLIRLDLIALGPQHDLEAARHQPLDMLIAPFSARGPLRAPRKFEVKKLFGERIVAMARAKHPIIKSKLTMATFKSAHHILIAPRGGWLQGSVDQAMAKLRLKRNIRMTVPHYMVVPHVVAHTDMIATLPERIARYCAQTASVRLFPVPLDVPEFSISMAWDPKFNHDSAHQWLRTHLLSICHTL